ncbi:pyridoxal phosphate-dependent aminotransferase [Clostridiaceae bacterium OttesenSCG-928-D20]|nr:pyridoxal phosphate-dependent aminotransferase [Clostridiaceae bacterium OttesenSCG-928-D20]
MKYDFDKLIDRRGTHAIKLDVLPDGSPEDTLSLWIADMDFPCAEPIIRALHERVDKKIFGYSHYDNHRVKSAAIDWFKRRFDWEIDPAAMFFSPGVVPAIGVLVNILSEKGDGIIIQRPVYYPFTTKIESNGRVVVNNALIREEGRYVMDFADLEAKFADPKNKGMILCSPHNPVGRVWTKEELLKVVEIAKKYDKWIISDEIHCDLTRKGVEHSPLLSLAPEYKNNIISCTAPSKTFNLAGMQFSNIIISKPEYQEKWVDYTNARLGISFCSPLGLEAVVAAYTEGEDWLEQVRDYIDENIKYIEDFARKELPLAEVFKCEATYLVWLDLGKYCKDSKELEQRMIKAGLALDEGYIFGLEGEGFERINVATSRENVRLCMQRMRSGVAVSN